MQPLDLTTRLQHAAEACETILTMTAGITFDDYRESVQIRWAVEHGFTIIGEALRLAAKIDTTVEARITGYRRIQDFRNVIVHDYATVYDEAVWRIIREHLPLLIAEIRALLSPP